MHLLTLVLNGFKIDVHWSNVHNISQWCNIGTIETWTASKGHSSRKVKQRIILRKDLISAPCFLAANRDESRQGLHTARSALLSFQVLQGCILTILEVKSLKYKKVKGHIKIKLIVISWKKHQYLFACIKLRWPGRNTFLSNMSCVLRSKGLTQQRTKWPY